MNENTNKALENLPEELRKKNLTWEEYVIANTELMSTVLKSAGETSSNYTDKIIETVQAEIMALVKMIALIHSEYKVVEMYKELLKQELKEKESKNE